MEYQIEIKPKRTAARDSILTKSEFALMMQATNDGKDQIIIALGLLGLRASEIAACQRAWVDFAQQTINLPTGVTKRCRGRIVPFGKFRVLREIITSFFMLEKAVGLSRIGVYQRVQRIASRAGITHPVTVHGLRATGATLMAQSGYSIAGLMAHFGWTEIKTATHYIESTGAAAMRDMERFGDQVI